MKVAHHPRNELDLRRLIRVILIKLHDEFEGTIFKGRVCGADDDGIPVRISIHVHIIPYQVMTFSLTGLALTPAGGSDCIRYD